MRISFIIHHRSFLSFRATVATGGVSKGAFILNLTLLNIPISTHCTFKPEANNSRQELYQNNFSRTLLLSEFSVFWEHLKGECIFLAS